MTSVVIRVEEEKDFRLNEDLVRDAFWDQYHPGADEHYVLYLLRKHPDVIPELNLIMEVEGELIGQIIYRKTKIISDIDKSIEFPVLSFGPVSVARKYQRKGYGSQLIRYSIDKARELGYEAIVIYGDPRYYHRFGFRCGEKFDVKTAKGQYAVSLNVLPLQQVSTSKFFSGQHSGRFLESECFAEINPEALDEFDSNFPRREKHTGTESQREFQVIVSLKY